MRALPVALPDPQRAIPVEMPGLMRALPIPAPLALFSLVRSTASQATPVVTARGAA
jgi:hypothetical protein